MPCQMLNEQTFQHGAQHGYCGIAGFSRQVDRNAATLCRLEQSILPNVTPPRPLDGLMKGEYRRLTFLKSHAVISGSAMAILVF